MEPLLELIDLLVNLYMVVLLARVLLPIFRISPFHPVMRAIYRLTEPVLAPLRAILPRAGMYDLSPLAAMIVLTVLQSILAALLTG
jgi:YggT family protein